MTVIMGSTLPIALAVRAKSVIWGVRMNVWRSLSHILAPVFTDL